jgi:predicted secreted Zn-dependent protease
VQRAQHDDAAPVMLDTFEFLKHRLTPQDCKAAAAATAATAARAHSAHDRCNSQFSEVTRQLVDSGCCRLREVGGGFGRLQSRLASA